MRQARGRHGLPLRALAAAAMLATALPVVAQSSNATLRGTVSSAGRAAPNAEVVATNLATGYALRARANANGDYTLIGLPPGSYRIVATAGGQTNESRITLQVGQATSLDLALVAGGTAAAPTTLNTVTVVGAARVDKDNSEIGTYVTTQQLERLPQVSRNFLSQADLAPGVNVEYDAQGNVKLRSGASARSAINVFIDGVGQKDYVLRGGTAGQDSSRGNPFPQSAIGEYKVITQNYKAEFDQVSSAVITAATRSGTNEFHGDAFVDHTGKSLRAATPSEKDAGEKTDSKQEQYGVSGGGAIVKDVLHWFVAYEGKDNRDPQTVAANAPAPIAALLPPAVAALQGPTNSPFHEDLLFAKLDFTLDERNHFDASFKYRKEKDRKHLGGTETEPFSSNNTIDEKRLDLHHQFSSDRFTNEARITYEKVFFGQVPVSSDNGVVYSYFSGTNANDLLRTGGNNFYQAKGQKGVALQNDLTWTGFDSHVVKGGVKLKWITVDALEQANGTPQYYYDLGGNLQTPYKVEVGYPLAGLGDGSTSTKNKQLGLYLQDDWQLTKQLTLNLGARYDIEWSPTYLDHQTPADVLAALNSQDTNPGAPAGQTYAQSLAKGGVNIGDYLGNGSNRKSFKGGFAPRLGFNYDLTGTQTVAVFGGWGRSYDRNIFDVIQLENTKGTYPSATINFSGPGGACAPGQATCIPYLPAYGTRAGLQPLITQNTGREIDLLSNNLKTPYSDQFSLGIRNALDVLGATWQTEVSVARIQQRDGFVWLLGNRQPAGNFYDPGHISGPPFGYPIPGLGSLIIGTNGVKSDVDALYLKLDKPYTRASKWGVTLAYTYSHTRENHNSADDFSYLLDYPTVAAAPMLRASTVPTHKLVATGTVDLPFGVIASAKATLATPLAIRDFNCNAVPNDCVADIAEKRTFRQFDFSVSKAVPLPGGINAGLRVDVINAFNAYNWQDFNVAWGGAGTATVSTPTGTLAAPPRTVKLGVFANW